MGELESIIEELPFDAFQLIGKLRPQTLSQHGFFHPVDSSIIALHSSK